MADHVTSIKWQQHPVFMAVNSLPQDDSTASSMDHYYDYDNYSNHCPFDDFYAQCPDQPVLMIALRWAKIFILKVGRMYYGAPLCLMMVPLLAGLSLGYMLGRHSTPTTSPKATSSSSLTSSQFSLYNLLRNLCTYFTFQKYLNSKQTQDQKLQQKEERVRQNLKSAAEATRESGVPLEKVPQHVAVIMDGNRRYGKRFHPENPTQGHWEGSKTLVEFCKWCVAEHISTLTVYAFSTENWNRSPNEVAALMAIFSKYCDELRIEAIQRNIRIRTLSTETSQIPAHVKAGMKRMVDETAHCTGGLTMNICLSYGSRGEIVHACRQVATDVQQGVLSVSDIDEAAVQNRLLANTDPDLVIRTSGEYRLSNFLLWQMAYSELFFVKKTWPEMRKEDLLEVIRAFAGGRDRRFGA